MATTKRTLLAMILAFAAIPATAGALERLRSKTTGAKALTRSYTVQLEGGRTEILWLDPDYVAEIGPKQTAEIGPTKAAEAGQGVKRYSSGARLHSEKKGLRVWKLGAGASSLTGMGAIQSAQPGAGYSHVFRAAPASAGAALVLDGRLLVRFQPTWDEARVRAWASARGLTVVSKLAVAGNRWVLQGEPGLSALEKANELRAGGEVLGAEPSLPLDLKAQ